MGNPFNVNVDKRQDVPTINFGRPGGSVEHNFETNLNIFGNIDSRLNTVDQRIDNLDVAGLIETIKKENQEAVDRANKKSTSEKIAQWTSLATAGISALSSLSSIGALQNAGRTGGSQSVDYTKLSDNDLNTRLRQAEANYNSYKGIVDQADADKRAAEAAKATAEGNATRLQGEIDTYNQTTIPGLEAERDGKLTPLNATLSSLQAELNELQGKKEEELTPQQKERLALLSDTTGKDGSIKKVQDEIKAIEDEYNKDPDGKIPKAKAERDAKINEKRHEDETALEQGDLVDAKKKVIDENEPKMQAAEREVKAIKTEQNRRKPQQGGQAGAGTQTQGRS